MPDTYARLKSALADRHAIERELGQGGMAWRRSVHRLQDFFS